MSTTILIIMGILIWMVLYIIVNLFTLTLNDFIEKIVKKTLWLWLPFHALKRLTKEFNKKYFK